MQTLMYKVNFAPEGIPTTVRLSQNENGRVLQFVLVGDRITIPEGSVVTISGTKPDGNVYSAEGTLDSEVASFDEELQMTAAAGEWAAKLKVTYNGLTVATQRLWMIIDADTVQPGSVPSESELNGLVAEAQQYAENARSAAYGSPLTAATAAGMIDTSRVYVYTGSETGMLFGHWYYYEDGEWEDGGVYQSQGVQTDTTLEILGMPADAKATGDALAGKVDAETGKGLSSNDFTTAEKTKLAGIADQATHVVIDSTLEQTGQAADAKVVGDEIDGLKEDLSDKISLVLNKIPIEKEMFSLSGWQMGYINATGVFATSTNSAVSNFFTLQAQVEEVILNGYKARLIEYSAPIAGTTYFVSRHDYVDKNKIANVNTTHFYRAVVMLKDEAAFTIDNLPANVLKFARYKNPIESYTNKYRIPKNSYIESSKYYITNNNVWSLATKSNTSLYYKIAPGYYKIAANPSFNTIYALLDINYTRPSANGQIPMFVQCTGRQVISAGETSIIYVQDECILYVYNVTTSGDIYYPVYIEAMTKTDPELSAVGISADALITGLELETVKQPLTEVFNLYNPNEVIEGMEINSAGTEALNAEYKTTDYIEIPQKYTKNLLYTHVTINGTYAGAVAFYDKNKNFIELVTVSNYITNLDSYAYMRCIFPVSSTAILIRATNENILPQTREQKINTNGYYNWFSNRIVSDGCLTAIIKTALAYTDNEDYGYGTEHIAFGETCIKTTKDTHTSSSTYEGERYQIDCSTYVCLAIMGIVPKCSRYHNTINVPAPYGYVFNDLVEYEGYVYGIAQTGNTKRLYANSIASYAYKNGWLYSVNDNFSNVEAGDILFLSNQGAGYNFFENIGHCMLVINVIPMANGTNAIETYEANGGSTNPCKRHIYTMKQDNCLYGAKLPYRYVKDCSKDIANFEIGELTPTTEILTVPLRESFKGGNIYTVVIHADNADGYFYLTIAGAAYAGYSNQNVLKRPDGITIIRFTLPMGYTENANSITLEYGGTIEEPINIDMFKVYDGYVTYPII